MLLKYCNILFMYIVRSLSMYIELFVLYKFDEKIKKINGLFVLYGILKLNFYNIFPWKT